MKAREEKMKTVLVLSTLLIVVGFLLFSKGKWEVVEEPKHGQLEVQTTSDGSFNFTYSPKAGYTGEDTFTIKAVFPIGETLPVRIKLMVDRDTVHIVDDE